MKKILITGASGFIGGFLVDEALKRNYEVFAGIRKTSNKTYLAHPSIKFVETNLSDKNSLKKTLKSQGKFDYIIHNAGITKTCKKDDLSGEEEILCLLTRNDQAEEKEFKCFAYESKYEK